MEIHPNTQDDMAKANLIAILLAAMMDDIANTYCMDPSHDHDGPLSGWDMLQNVRDAQRGLVHLFEYVAKTAMFDGSMPDREREILFPGAMSMTADGPVYTMDDTPDAQ